MFATTACAEYPMHSAMSLSGLEHGQCRLRERGQLLGRALGSTSMRTKPAWTFPQSSPTRSLAEEARL
jgi:hypothetical protein